MREQKPIDTCCGLHFYFLQLVVDFEERLVVRAGAAATNQVFEIVISHKTGHVHAVSRLFL